jgi:type I restriction enzyme R subunit
MSNFAFLQAEWPDLYRTARRVEEYLQSDPRSACFHARRALELAVQWLYQHDKSFRYPYDDNLAALLNESSFREHVPPAVYTKADLIRRTGNIAVHSRKAIPAQSALGAAIELRHVLYWLARTYTKGDPSAIPTKFDEALLPPPAAHVVQQSTAQLQDLDDKLKEQDKSLRQALKENEALKAQLAAAQVQTQIRKAANQAIPDTHDYSEAETRQKIIDLMLREAGWDPHGRDVCEYPVVGMPFASGKGKVDYVLWGDDGLPLGLVEAKRTSTDPYKGKQQAKLYADCLEQMHGQRPIIFYTNGYKTWLWDDRRYPERPVQGFFTKDELALLIQRRTLAQPLADVPVNQAIVNRYYQEAAIRHMTEHFGRNFRKGLLVMATGTGKTRVAIALVDLLMRAGWVKRVLFLADRSALVRQAAKAFKAHLPSSSPVNLTESTGKEQAPAARVVVSTYHTMMNLIDTAQDNGQRLFSVGHFDLVIIDEAHRSVYQKFGAIFNYFDSLLVGLTATPKDEVDRNTYRLFELEDGVPTYAYHLTEAVPDGYLVPYRSGDVSTKFIRQGISKYEDLSEEEKEEWDMLEWGDSDDIPDKVDAAALNAWLFNENTVDRVLQSLMEHGLKVAGGDRLGKTIIFAKNHKHAVFIEQRFNAHYPHYDGNFARVIDHELNFAQDVIDKFSMPDSEPHIAISVDMLDTGIDVPEVVNLLFFKVVRSKTKFFQMIGRGTRLCPDLFGPGQDKEYFLILDACQNFEFFNQHPEGVKTSQPEPLGQMLFKKRLTLLEQMRRLVRHDPALADLARSLADALHAHVASMKVDNFIVRPQRQYVEPFQERGRWDHLSRTDAAQLAQYVSGLPTQLPEDEETAKRFDHLILQLQLAHLDGGNSFFALRDRVIETAVNLETKTGIPRVYAQLAFIQDVQTEAFWEGITLPLLEEIRLRLRDLVIHADKSRRVELYTTFRDEGSPMRESGGSYETSGVNMVQYRKKVEQFLREHEDYWVIQKIRRAIPLDAYDLAALEEFFYKAEPVGGPRAVHALFWPAGESGCVCAQPGGAGSEGRQRAVCCFSRRSCVYGRSNPFCQLHH